MLLSGNRAERESRDYIWKGACSAAAVSFWEITFGITKQGGLKSDLKIIKH
jgi:hypothetical protein